MHLNYTFANKQLLEEALTHPSLCKNNNIASYERLEFLGDRVIGLCIAEMVYKLYPNANEGTLSVLFSALVGTKILASVATEIRLGDMIKMDSGEEKNGGRINPSNLENALEAIIGAIYIDAGYPKVSQLIEALWKDKVSGLNIETLKNPKSALQEWAQQNGKPIPLYEIIKQEGLAHNPNFTVKLKVEGLHPILAFGKSKKEAEVNAAKMMLKEIENL